MSGVRSRVGVNKSVHKEKQNVILDLDFLKSRLSKARFMNPKLL